MIFVDFLLIFLFHSVGATKKLFILGSGNLIINYYRCAIMMRVLAKDSRFQVRMADADRQFHQLTPILHHITLGGWTIFSYLAYARASFCKN